MKNLKIFPKMFIQIFSVLAVIILLIHSLVFFIFPKTYLETRKEEITEKADEISKNLNGKDLDTVKQSLDFYSKSSDIKAFVNDNVKDNEVPIENNIGIDQVATTP